MGSSLEQSAAPSAEFLAAFARRADAAGRLTFAEFMALALYDPEVGYYTRPRDRIGCEPGTDFYTASTSNPMFGELIAAACVSLLGGEDPSAFTFVEIGAEPKRGVLRDVPHPFAAVRELRPGEPLSLRGRCVVFSNELFDAQPVRRVQGRSGLWHESYVVVDGSSLAEEFLPVNRDDPLLATLPTDAAEGYVIDVPAAARSLIAEIAGQEWTGVFLAFDYGKSWEEIATACPAGTARAYFRHTKSNDLLARPGAQDLTAHVCWDWLRDELEANRFSSVGLDSQESFLVRHAGRAIASTLAAEAARFSPRKMSLMQLLHPVHLGQKFQVLHGRRF